MLSFVIDNLTTVSFLLYYKKGNHPHNDNFLDWVLSFIVRWDLKHTEKYKYLIKNGL